MFTANEAIRAVERCPVGVCKKNYIIIINDQPTIYKDKNGEAYYQAQGRIGGSPLQGVHMVPESVKNDPYRGDNLNWLKVKIFGTARIDSGDVQVGCATPSC
jgi:hypothetical protein